MPCLEAAGYTTAGLPSESVFIETWYTDPFFPFAQVQINVPPENFNTAWAALEAQCPQIAPAGVAWGGVSVEDWVAQSGR